MTQSGHFVLPVQPLRFLTNLRLLSSFIGFALFQRATFCYVSISGTIKDQRDEPDNNNNFSRGHIVLGYFK